jgi:NTP pyrophosphatase (non-canonical NTP hydrolase)|tara:strand:+ start:402 stop:722 length:321 start_codon:yes stop_codon:yes gene_type:complete
MNIKDYQLWTRDTAIYRWAVFYPAMELAGEAGEVLNQVKKAHRDDDDTFTPERRDALKKELGDVCWALCRLADDLDLDMEEVLQYNHDKLTSRMKAGTIKGSGDDR